MRAALIDQRLEAIAGPLLGYWRDPEFRTPIPETGDHPVTVAVAVTPGIEGGGGYVFNSPTDADGRRAYAWFFGALGSVPYSMGAGFPALTVGNVEPGKPSVFTFEIGRGIPPSTYVRQSSGTEITGSKGHIHCVAAWPRTLTEHDRLRVRLSLSLSLSRPLTRRTDWAWAA